MKNEQGEFHHAGPGGDSREEERSQNGGYGLKTVLSLLVVGVVGAATFIAAVVVALLLLAQFGDTPITGVATATGWTLIGTITAAGLAGIGISLRRIWIGAPRRAVPAVGAIVVQILAFAVALVGENRL